MLRALSRCLCLFAVATCAIGGRTSKRPPPERLPPESTGRLGMRARGRWRVTAHRAAAGESTASTASDPLSLDDPGSRWRIKGRATGHYMYLRDGVVTTSGRLFSLFRIQQVRPGMYRMGIHSGPWLAAAQSDARLCASMPRNASSEFWVRPEADGAYSLAATVDKRAWLCEAPRQGKESQQEASYASSVLCATSDEGQPRPVSALFELQRVIDGMRPIPRKHTVHSSATPHFSVTTLPTPVPTTITTCNNPAADWFGCCSGLQERIPSSVDVRTTRSSRKCVEQR